MSDIVLITSYCGGVNPQQKEHMTKTICKKIKEQGLQVCLATHSPVDIETQKYCDLVVYDADNSFKYCGYPSRDNNHGVAELKSVWNAISILEKKGYTHFLKVAYDNIPTLDYVDLIQKCRDTKKDIVTAKWGNNVTFGFHMFYSNIDMFWDTCGESVVLKCDKDLEYAWYDRTVEQGLMDFVHLIENYHDFLGHNIIQYCHAGGTIVDGYPYE